MTLAPGHLYSGGDTPGLLPGRVPGSSPATQAESQPVPHLPRLADGVELLGAYQDSGYRDPPSLARRPAGQIIQMAPPLYGALSRIDGVRDSAAIADLVSADLGRALSADQVRFLLSAKLLPLGVVGAEGGAGGAP